MSATIAAILPSRSSCPSPDWPPNAAWRREPRQRDRTLSSNATLPSFELHPERAEAEVSMMMAMPSMPSECIEGR